LAPLDHIGLTTAQSPSLFWFVDGIAPDTAYFKVTLIRFAAMEPLLEARLSVPAAAGIQRIDLSEYEISLEEEVAYQWSVTLVADPANRSFDRVSMGGIARTGQQTEDRSPQGLAAEGLWYDTLETLLDAVAADPGDATAHALRDSLLRQAGLDDVVLTTR